jgi:hypothetical protein
MASGNTILPAGPAPFQPGSTDRYFNKVPESAELQLIEP